MASVRFLDVQSRPVEFLEFTSLTLDEFQQLVPPFEAAFQAHMAAWRLDGKPRAARQFAVYKNCPLPTSEDRLFCTPLSCFELQQTTSHFTMPVCCLANTEAKMSSALCPSWSRSCAYRISASPLMHMSLCPDNVILAGLLGSFAPCSV